MLARLPCLLLLVAVVLGSSTHDLNDHMQIMPSFKMSDFECFIDDERAGYMRVIKISTRHEIAVSSAQLAA